VTGAAVENFPAGRSDKLPSDAMYFPWFLMADKRSEFDFPSWVAKPVLPHSFYGCVRSAADILALGRGGLRSRLYNALFCLCFCDGRDVPKSLQADFDSVRHEIQRRAGAAEDVQLWNVDLDQLRHSIRRCNLSTARRIAGMIIKWDRALALKAGGGTL